MISNDNNNENGFDITATATANNYPRVYSSLADKLQAYATATRAKKK